MGNYAQPSDIANFLQTTISSNSTPNSDVVETWIDIAESEINDKSGTSWTTSAIEDVYISSNGSRELWIDSQYKPLVSLTDVEVNTGTDFDATWVAKTEGTNYLILDLKTGRIKFSPSDTIRAIERAVKIGTLVYGYDSVPDIVKGITIKKAALMYINSVLSNTNISTTEKIRVGPITIENSSSEGVNYIRNLKQDIASSMEKLGTFNTYIY